MSVNFKCYKFNLSRSFIMYENKKDLEKSLFRQQDMTESATCRQLSMPPKLNNSQVVGYNITESLF